MKNSARKKKTELISSDILKGLSYALIVPLAFVTDGLSIVAFSGSSIVASVSGQALNEKGKRGKISSSSLVESATIQTALAGAGFLAGKAITNYTGNLASKVVSEDYGMFGENFERESVVQQGSFESRVNYLYNKEVNKTVDYHGAYGHNPERANLWTRKATRKSYFTTQKENMYFIPQILKHNGIQEHKFNNPYDSMLYDINFHGNEDFMEKFYRFKNLKFDEKKVILTKFEKYQNKLLLHVRYDNDDFLFFRSDGYFNEEDQGIFFPTHGMEYVEDYWGDNPQPIQTLDDVFKNEITSKTNIVGNKTKVFNKFRAIHGGSEFYSDFSKHLSKKIYDLRNAFLI